MRGWLDRMLGRAAVSDPALLEAFLHRQAAYVAQKTAMDYCRVKAGRREREMFADPDFIAALRHCRWQTFAGAVLDVSALAEAFLRPHAGADTPALADALAAMGRRILNDAPAPAEDRAALSDSAARIDRHLAAMQAAPPASADRLRLESEAPLLATLPIHPDQRIGETPSIRGALRFHIVATQQELERGFVPGPLAARLFVL